MSSQLLDYKVYDVEKALRPKEVVPMLTTNFGLVDGINIYVIGVGGTGSHLVGALSSVMANSNSIAGGRIKTLTLIDGDLVSPHNVGRQLFSRKEINRYKAEALALRYVQNYGLPIRYINRMFSGFGSGSDLIGIGTFNNPTFVISCVDKATCRKQIFEQLTSFNFGPRQSIYWMDFGNGHREGQIGIGNTADPKLIKEGYNKPVVEFIPYLPCLDLFSRTIDPESDKDEVAPGGCITQVMAQLQSENINRIMAAIGIEMICQFLEGRLSNHYVYINIKPTEFKMMAQPINDLHLEAVVDELSEKKKGKK